MIIDQIDDGQYSPDSLAGRGYYQRVVSRRRLHPGGSQGDPEPQQAGARHPGCTSAGRTPAPPCEIGNRQPTRLYPAAHHRPAPAWPRRCSPSALSTCLSTWGGVSPDRVFCWPTGPPEGAHCPSSPMAAPTSPVWPGCRVVCLRQTTTVAFTVALRFPWTPSARPSGAGPVPRPSHMPACLDSLDFPL